MGRKPNGAHSKTGPTGSKMRPKREWVFRSKMPIIYLLD